MQGTSKVAQMIPSLLRRIPSATRCSCSVIQTSQYRRPYCTGAAMSPAVPEGQEKQYAPKIQNIVEDISNLTLIEVADLNELLKKTLKISDAPMMAMGAAPAAAQAEEDEEVEVKSEKVSFTVKLVKIDASKKVAAIKEVKSLVAGMNLVQAKKFVESVPQVLQSDVTKEEAESLKEKLAAVGAEVEID